MDQQGAAEAFQILPVYWPERPGASVKATPGGSSPPHGLPSRAKAQKYPVLVRLRPAARTGTGILSIKSLVDRFGLDISAL